MTEYNLLLNIYMYSNFPLPSASLLPPCYNSILIFLPLLSAIFIFSLPLSIPSLSYCKIERKGQRGMKFSEVNGFREIAVLQVS